MMTDTVGRNIENAKQLKKSELIDLLVNGTVNPNWEGRKADDSRASYRREFSKLR